MTSVESRSRCSAWVSVPFIAAGLIAWWRRPASRLGKLMVVGGFASALSALQFAELPLFFTVGALFDIVPAALFLHIYLAFPEGRLKSRGERLLVATAYVAAVGLQPFKLAVADRGPHNLLEVSVRPGADLAISRVQLLTISACCLVGIVMLLNRRRRVGRPLRRPLALLIDSFVLGLLMIAILFTSGVIEWFEGDTFLAIQRATLFVIGLAPIAFLIGAPRCASRPSGGRRPCAGASLRPRTGRTARRARPCAARPLAGARVLAARVRHLRRCQRSPG